MHNCTKKVKKIIRENNATRLTNEKLKNMQILVIKDITGLTNKSTLDYSRKKKTNRKG